MACVAALQALNQGPGGGAVDAVERKLIVEASGIEPTLLDRELVGVGDEGLHVSDEMRRLWAIGRCTTIDELDCALAEARSIGHELLHEVRLLLVALELRRRSKQIRNRREAIRSVLGGQCREHVVALDDIDQIPLDVIDVFRGVGVGAK